MNALRYYDLGYAEVFVYHNYLVNQIKEGQTVTMEHVQVLRDMVNQHFQDREMIYISNRANVYTVDPMVYQEVSKIKNILGIAMVVYTERRHTTTLFEKQFYSRPFKIFEQLSEAMIWAVSIIEDQKKNHSSQ
jgi:hypothetical protein